ncbi:MAG: crossover junction endodeoxyribonuclease RuvC [Nitrospirota bacterium]
MRILGIDPGTRTAGYGVIDGDGYRVRFIAAGVIRPAARETLPRRLLHLADCVDEMILAHRPDVVVVENLFFSRNVRSALALGQAQAAVFLSAARRDIPLFEYPPATVKKAVVGTGNAEKAQVRRMVRVLLNLDHDLDPMDISDALAVAICHLHQHRHLSAVSGLPGVSGLSAAVARSVRSSHPASVVPAGGAPSSAGLLRRGGGR